MLETINRLMSIVLDSGDRNVQEMDVAVRVRDSDRLGVIPVSSGG